MVLGIKELEARIVEKEGGKLKAFERRIDEALENSYHNDSVTIAVSREDPRNFLRDKLFGEYKSKGWDVTIIYDQRDGDYYKFKPRQNNDHYFANNNNTRTQNLAMFGPFF